MDIKFFRGDFHQTKFRFKSYKGPIDKMYFTVKDSNRQVQLTKKLNDGITKEGDWYIITFLPEDTNELPYWLDMIYDIEIFIGETKPITVVKAAFDLEEDVIDLTKPLKKDNQNNTNSDVLVRKEQSLEAPVINKDSFFGASLGGGGQITI